MNESLPTNIHWTPREKAEILKRWIKELSDNPSFSKNLSQSPESVAKHSEDFLNQAIQLLEDKKLPELDLSVLDPILKLWHYLLREQQELGSTTQDTAMLIFSLKSTLLQSLEEKPGQTDLKSLNTLLDFLGLLTFEIYTAEKERLINHQKSQITYLQKQQFKSVFDNIIGNSQKMADIFKAIGLILENDISVLLEGESGTGKSLIASNIHQHSTRKDYPFVTINCGAIPKELMESELFGHEKGAFTGATERKIGKFELAQKGTLFLDEISELSLELQVKLLRVLQNKEIERVGGNQTLKADVRIIAATNQNLKSLVDQKLFRLDLFYRINVFPLMIPPLRERKEDILPLALHFLNKYAKQFGVDTPSLADDAKSFLLNHKFEGNIRELENLIQRSLIFSQGGIITANTFTLHPGKSEGISEQLRLEAPKNPVLLLDDNVIPLEELEERAVRHALAVNRGNIFKTAQALGVSRTTFYNKVKKYGIVVDRSKS